VIGGRKVRKNDMRLKTFNANAPSFNTGLNEFVWDMRYDAVEFLKLQPIAAPGKYKAKLSIDGVDQISEFELSINPNETYTQAQLDAKKKFWMELYSAANTSSQKIRVALATQKEVMAKAESQKTVQAQAEAVSKVVDEYKAVYIKG